jgi:hypothetical protein
MVREVECMIKTTMMLTGTIILDILETNKTILLDLNKRLLQLVKYSTLIYFIEEYETCTDNGKGSTDMNVNDESF